MTMSHSKLRVCNDYIFVKPMPDPEVVRGIFIPQTAENITQRGEVKYLKEGGADSNIKMSDIVLFKKRNAFRTVQLDSVTYNVLHKHEVLAIMFGDGVTDVTPTKDNVFLEWEMSQSFFEGTNIARPESTKEMHYTGVVVAVGPDVKECAVGDRVFFDQFGGVEKFQENEKRYGFVKDEAIWMSGLPKRKEVAV